MNKGRLLILTLFVCRFADADVTYDVDLNTTGLIGDSAGPFSAAFQLTDGSFLGDGNNTVSITNFAFGGGGVSGPAATLGTVTGDLNSSVTLADGTFLNYLIQPFNPGISLSFTISATTNTDTSGGVDQFSFSILDSTGQQIPTEGGLLAPYFDVFLAIEFDSANPTIETFASDSAEAPAGGGPAIITGMPQAVLVPEPNLTPLVLSLVGLVILGRSLNYKRTWQTVQMAHRTEWHSCFQRYGRISLSYWRKRTGSHKS